MDFHSLQNIHFTQHFTYKPKQYKSNIIKMKNSFALLLITIALIATFAIAHPAPNPHGESSGQEIHVTSPGPGPWAVKSSQAVNWWSLNIEADGKLLDSLTYLKFIYLFVLFFITNEIL